MAGVFEQAEYPETIDEKLPWDRFVSVASANVYDGNRLAIESKGLSLCANGPEIDSGYRGAAI